MWLVHERALQHGYPLHASASGQRHVHLLHVQGWADAVVDG